MSGTEDEEDHAPEPDATPDASDPQQQKRHRRRKETEAEGIARFWRVVLGDRAGRKEFWRLLTDYTNAFNDQFPTGPGGFPYPAAKWFADGQKSVGMRLYAERQVDCWDLLLLVHQENDPRFSKPKQKSAVPSQFSDEGR